MTRHEKFTLTGGEATQITPNGTHSGMDITIQNINTNANVFVGGEGVTTSEFGFKITPGAAVSFELSGQDDLFICSDESPATAAVIKINLED